MKAFLVLIIFCLFIALKSKDAQASNVEVLRLTNNHECSHSISSNNLERFSEKRMIDIKNCAKEGAIKTIVQHCKDKFSGKLRFSRASLVDCSENIINGQSLLSCNYKATGICLYTLR